MSETPFFKTRMGHQFYDQTMPALVRQLERLNEQLERLLDKCQETPSDRTTSSSSDS